MNKTVQPSILVALDHGILRQALCNYITSFSKRFKVSGISSVVDDVAFPDKVRLAHIVIVDMQPPANAWTELITSIRKANPDVRVISLVQSGDEAAVQEILHIPVNAILSRESLLRDLKTAIARVLQGEFFYDQFTLEVMRKSNITQSQEHTNGISFRETQIMELIADGLTNKEMSARLHLSVRTIESYRKSLMKKPRAETRRTLSD